MMKSSVHNIPGLNSYAAFVTDTADVFRESGDVSPILITENDSIMPWGGDNMMPYEIIELIESDETVSTCQIFNSEISYGAGLEYDTSEALPNNAKEVDNFFLNNDIPSYFLGTNIDFKFFGFAISLFILNADCSKIVALERKEACYCRFAKADENGNIPYVYYANWRYPVGADGILGKYPLLNQNSPLNDLRSRIKKGTKDRIFAVLSKIPTHDSTYYPIPYYASIFKSKWYNIKRLIAVAKEAGLKNNAPIKYQIEISQKYWDSIWRIEGITDPAEQKKRVNLEKEKILEFLTGAENSGKVWFSTFYVTPDGKESHDVVINKIDSDKQGGDYATDIQEAVNMICFTLRVHSNLVGSVPGKAQSNNSGSDKRELYTIAQALQKPYHDIIMRLHKIICMFNGWDNVKPVIPFIQLTTLDEHKDAKKVEI